MCSGERGKQSVFWRSFCTAETESGKARSIRVPPSRSIGTGTFVFLPSGLFKGQKRLLAISSLTLCTLRWKISLGDRPGAGAQGLVSQRCIPRGRGHRWRRWPCQRSLSWSCLSLACSRSFSSSPALPSPSAASPEGTGWGELLQLGFICV